MSAGSAVGGPAATGLQVEGLGHRHAGGTGWALRGVDLAVEPGQVLAVVGPSGSGKTTLLRLLSGLLEPTEGSVSIGGVPQAGVPPERRPVAMVFQGYALFPHLTVADNIAFGLRVRRAGREQRRARTGQAAAALGLPKATSPYHQGLPHRGSDGGVRCPSGLPSPSSAPQPVTNW